VQRAAAHRASGTGAVAALVAGLLAILAAACAGGTVDPVGPDAPAAPAVPSTPIAPPDADAAPPVPAPEDSPARAPGLPDAATTLPPLELVEVAVLEAPIDTTLLADGTVLVAERAGTIRVLEGPDAGRLELDVRDRTSTESERGLLSIAVAPWGDELFLSLTDTDGDTLVEAHPLDGSIVVGPPRTIYTTEQPFANHNGGAILFLPDGTLLLGLGDGGGAGDPLGAAQDLATPLGAIVRLDARAGGGAAPPDNPFVGRPGAAPEIAATGLRNPWRMTLDVAREELWIADVGQSAREEINRVTIPELLGANFGWPLREGNASYLGDEPEGHLPPVHDYAHGPGCSITGGLVYRGSRILGLVGAYVFSDYCDGELRVLVDADGEVVSRPLGVAGERIVGFGTDAAGELLVLELDGRVLRLSPS